MSHKVSPALSCQANAPPFTLVSLVWHGLLPGNWSQPSHGPIYCQPLPASCCLPDFSQV